ncbi:hypothetical protein V8C35DRAFT_325486 [Trichoderma chlorosporum]
MSASPDPADSQGQTTVEQRDSSPVAEDDSLLPIEAGSQPDDSYTWDNLYNRRIRKYQKQRGTEKIADIIYVSLLRLQRIESLVAQDDKELQIDDCIRWWILLKAVEEMEEDAEDEDKVNETVGAEKDTNLLIIYIITKIAPYLAFEVYKVSGWIFHDGKLHDKEDRCKFPHSHQTEGTKSPFQLATDYGHSKAVRHMIGHGSTFSWNDSDESPHDTFVQILRQPYLASGYRGHSALRIAVDNEKYGFHVVKVLLDFDPDIAAPPDTTFDYALENSRMDILNIYLQYDLLKEMYITRKRILRAMDLCAAWHSKVSLDVRVVVVFSLIKNMPSGISMGYDIIEKMIQLRFRRLWAIVRGLVSELNTGRFLHLAVSHQSVEFVDIFLREYPDSVTYQWEGKYPLWHNNNLPMEQLDKEDALTRESIRDMLASAMIKKIPTISDILDIFQMSGAKEICLDLSGFQSSNQSMSDLFRGLINQNDHTNLLSYERSLRYVEFPALALVAEEKRAFDSNWLRTAKGVQHIWELIVRDRLFSPHDEVRIAEHVRAFNVEVLNWKMIDMSISIFEEESAKKIKELCLYASGKRAVISHWLSSEGISSLPGLEVLNIYVIRDLMTKENCKTTFAYVSEKFGELSEKINEKRRLDGHEELFVNVNIEGWDPVYEEKLLELEEISERIVPKLSQFTKRYCNLVQNLRFTESRKHRPTRIAIIDNGMLDISSDTGNVGDATANRQQLDARHPKGKHERFSGRPSDGTLWSRIKEGRSFVDDGNRVSQWFLASDPHGTQMARIIGSIDPCCDLYVARVSSGRSGISPSRVAKVGYVPAPPSKAIRWAISKEVDVISMSFALRQTTYELQQNCHEAADRGIAMLCSAHDEGTNLAHAWPADFAYTITITTCDEFGTVPPRNRSQRYEFAIDGQNVPVGIVPFLNSSEYVSGSSVATAIAAGLSSLILSCSRLAGGQDDDYAGRKRAEVVRRHLQKMAVNESQFVQPEKFAGIDLYINEGRDIDIESILDQVFSKSLS